MTDYNHRVQVFSYNGDYLFMFSEKMNYPVGICVFQNTVFVTQYDGHCVNMYELEGKLMKSVGSNGNGEAQFNYPYGIDVSDRNHNIYVCDYGNNRIQDPDRRTEVSFHARNRLVYIHHVTLR